MKYVTESQKILTTKRLILRPLIIEDADWIQKKFSKWEIIKFLNSRIPWPYPDDGALTFLRDMVLPSMKKNKAIHWGIFLKDKPDEGIGVISFRHEADEYDGHRGFWMDIAHQGQGCMTEAVSAVNDFVFDVLEYDSFLAENAVSNIGSRRVKEKTGAVLIEKKERHFNFGSENAEIWAITKETWKKRKNT